MHALVQAIILRDSAGPKAEQAIVFDGLPTPPPQNTSRAPNWMVRNRLAVAVMVPNALLLAVVLGAANTGWLRTLYASMRICTAAFSVSVKRLEMDGSHWLMPSARRLEKAVGKVRM
jgi:hypothetical protein